MGRNVAGIRGCQFYPYPVGLITTMLISFRTPPLANCNTSCLSTFLVDAVLIEDSCWVVITDIDEGPSITNTVETACPAIAELLGQPMQMCCFFERYDHRDVSEVSRIDRIQFQTIEPTVSCSGLRKAVLSDSEPWRPATSEEQRILHAAGLVESGSATRF